MQRGTGDPTPFPGRGATGGTDPRRVPADARNIVFDHGSAGSLVAAGTGLLAVTCPSDVLMVPAGFVDEVATRLRDVRVWLVVQARPSVPRRPVISSTR